MTTRAHKSALAVGAHIVGSIKAETAEEAMRAVVGTLGNHVYAVTDGETGPRSRWVEAQMSSLTSLDGIQISGANDDYRKDLSRLEIDESVTELPCRMLGYANAAEDSYQTFSRLRADGVIPEGVKFQVSIPTSMAFVVAFVAEEHQERFYRIHVEAMKTEVADIVKTIPAGDLMLQLDICIELAVLTGHMPAAGKLSEKKFIFDEVRHLLELPPTGVDRGMHLCYGDFGHTHFMSPPDLSLCVEFANALCGAFDFVHMPVDRENGLSPQYHEPLQDLSGDGRLALGVIDYHGDEQRTRDLCAAAAGYAPFDFAVGAECGMARIDEGPFPCSLQRMLDLHAAMAQPIR